MLHRIKRDPENIKRLRLELCEARAALTIAREELARQMLKVEAHVMIVAERLRRLDTALDEHPELVAP